MTRRLTTSTTTRRRTAVRAAVVVIALAATGISGPGMSGTMSAAHAAVSPTYANEPGAADIFATGNKAIITDPNDPRLSDRLVAFDREVRGMIRANGADPAPSALLDGVFWSQELGKVTFERSRRFPVTEVGSANLRHIAATIRKRYDQESVLTFEHLPKNSAAVDAFAIEVDDIDVRRLHDGLRADPTARKELVGGSVTVDGGDLILVAELDDRELVRGFITRLGGRWNPATIEYGDREFVAAD